MPTKADQELKRRTTTIRRLLTAEYPDARCMLNHQDPLQLLVATILAAQCTDERVNMITPSLFRNYHTAADFAAADPDKLEEEIRPTGFFRNKSCSIQKSCAQIAAQHGGRVPDTMEALVALPGVGRKTANVVLSECYGKPGIIVDTHLKRVTTRLGLARQEDPDKIEAEMDILVPAKSRAAFSHAVTFHGRRVCKARTPQCEECCVKSRCEYGGKK